jgi:phospholipase/carboxylesterase
LHVFPDGPRQAFDGADPTMRAWYERGGNETADPVRDALASLDAFVRHVTERYRTPQGRVVLWGFSQGGAVALRYALPRPETFAGVASLSGSLRRVQDLTADLPPARNQKVFITHGRADAVVPWTWSQAVAAALEQLGYRPTTRLYSSVGHSITPKLVSDFRAWLQSVL